MLHDADVAAGISALLATAGRVLREAREPAAARLALSATLCLLVPEAHLLSETAAEATALVEQASTLLREAAGQRVALSQLYIRRHYAHWAAVLLGPVVRDWHGALTKAELGDLLYPHFLRAPPRSALEAISAALRPEPPAPERGGGEHGGGEGGRPGSHGGADDASRPSSSRQRAATRQRARVCAELLQSLVASGFAQRLFDASAADARHSIGFAASGTEDDPEADSLISLLVTLPDRLANALGAAPPPDLRAEAFARVVVAQLLQACAREAAAGGGTPRAPNQAGAAGASRTARLGAALLGRLSRRTHLGQVLPLLLPPAGAAETRERGLGPVAAPTLEAAAMLGLVSGASVEPLLEALLRYAAATAQPPERLCALLSPLLRSSASARFVLSSRLLLTRVLPLATLPHTVALLRATPGGDGASGGALGGAMLAVADAWSSPLHVASAPVAQQEYLTRALAAGLASLPRDSAQALLPPLLSGVQHHLQSPSARLRRLGMDVAEKLSLVIDPSNPVSFDRDSDEESDEAETALGAVEPRTVPGGQGGGAGGAGGAASCGDAAVAVAEKRKQGSRRRARRRAAAAAVAASSVADGADSSEDEGDPFGAVQLGWQEEEGAVGTEPREHAGGAEPGLEEEEGEEDEGSSACSDGGESSGVESGSASSSEESLAPFDLADDRTDLKSARAPRHLRQLLAGLRAKEGEHELLSASLSSAARLVRSCASAGGLGAASAATSRMAELQAMAEPLCRTLLHLGNAYALPQFGAWRRNGLVALAVACPEQLAAPLVAEFYGSNHTLEMRMEALAAIRAAADEMAAPPPSSTAAASASSAPGSAREPVAPVGKSRRWHSKPRAPPVSAASRLATVAPLFFFPLMHKYDDPTHAFRMLGVDCFLLEALLLTLAALLRGTGAYPCARPMARALCDLAWVLRLHSDGAVRRAVLVCFGTVAQALSAVVVVQELGGSLDGIQEWLAGVVADDPDEGCQALGAACHSLLANRLREYHGQA